MRTIRQREAQARATAASAAAKRAAALAATKKVLPVIRRLRARGLSYGKIAAELNGRGHTTRAGGGWYAALVYKILRRDDGKGGARDDHTPER
jgi:Recombinase